VDLDFRSFSVRGGMRYETSDLEVHLADRLLQQKITGDLSYESISDGWCGLYW